MKIAGLALLFPGTLVVLLMGNRLANFAMVNTLHETFAVAAFFLINALFWVAVSHFVRKRPSSAKVAN